MNALRATIQRNTLKTFGRRFASTAPLPKPPIPVSHSETTTTTIIYYGIHTIDTRESNMIDLLYICYLFHY